MIVSSLYSRGITAAEINLLRSRAATARRKLQTLVEDVENRFGSCNLRDEAAAAELAARKLEERLSDIRRGNATP